MWPPGKRQGIELDARHLSSGSGGLPRGFACHRNQRQDQALRHHVASVMHSVPSEIAWIAALSMSRNIRVVTPSARLRMAWRQARGIKFRLLAQREDTRQG